MASGTCRRLDELPEAAMEILEIARRAVLVTLAPDGSPRPVPVCFVVTGPRILLPIDAKPKSGRTLARVRNIERDARVALLFDRWDEDWRRLGWVAVQGRARLRDHADAGGELVERYPQYEELGAPSGWIEVDPERVSWWTWQ